MPRLRLLQLHTSRIQWTCSLPFQHATHSMEMRERGPEWLAGLAGGVKGSRIPAVFELFSEKVFSLFCCADDTHDSLTVAQKSQGRHLPLRHLFLRLLVSGRGPYPCGSNDVNVCTGTCYIPTYRRMGSFFDGVPVGRFANP